MNSATFRRNSFCASVFAIPRTAGLRYPAVELEAPTSTLESAPAPPAPRYNESHLETYGNRSARARRRVRTHVPSLAHAGIREPRPPLPDTPIRPILDFRAAADRNPTSRDERAAILDQAALLFTNLYPHLPFKLDRFDFAKPVDFIDQHIRTQIDDLRRDPLPLLRARGFLARPRRPYGVCAASPYKGAVAFLPFQMRHYSDAAGLHFVVTKVMNSTPNGGFGHPFFDKGVEILGWGDGPIVDHIFRAAGRLAGGNQSALLTRASISCTIRPLTFVQFPFDDEMPSRQSSIAPPRAATFSRFNCPGVSAPRSAPNSPAAPSA